MWRFDFLAASDPQTLPCVIGAFAQHSLVPSGIKMHREGEMLRIQLFLDSSPTVNAAVPIVGAKLEQVALVETVAFRMLVNRGRPRAPTFEHPARTA